MYIPKKGGDVTILLVDDDIGFLNSVEACLTSRGCEVVSATNGARALNILQHSMETTPCIKLVVTDLLMPGMSGVDLILSGRRLNPGLKFILMTAYGAPGVRKIASELRIGWYIEKPFTLKEMLEAIATQSQSECGKKERGEKKWKFMPMVAEKKGSS